MRVYLGGHLAYYNHQKQTWFEQRLLVATPLAQVLEQAGVPAGEIMLAVVNDEVVDIKIKVVNDQDIVKIYPPYDGG